MATVTVKNIPDELYARLKSVAAMNRRSINSEIIMCIDRAVVSRPINPVKIICDAMKHWAPPVADQSETAGP